jgi:hypothetical protein
MRFRYKPNWSAARHSNPPPHPRSPASITLITPTTLITLITMPTTPRDTPAFSTHLSGDLPTSYARCSILPLFTPFPPNASPTASCPQPPATSPAHPLKSQVDCPTQLLTAHCSLLTFTPHLEENPGGQSIGHSTAHPYRGVTLSPFEQKPRSQNLQSRVKGSKCQ